MKIINRELVILNGERIAIDTQIVQLIYHQLFWGKTTCSERSETENIYQTHDKSK